MEAAAKLVKSVCCKVLKANWETSIEIFQNESNIMRDELENMYIQELDQFQEIDKIRKRVRELTRPTPKKLFLLYHLRFFHYIT